MSMDSVLAEVVKERKRQDEKWGQQNHNPFAWLAILGEEFGEVAKATVEAHFVAEASWAPYRKELLHVAAVAVAMIESFDRNVVVEAGCEVCGCTEDHACNNGCSWDPTFKKAGRDVCSNCVGKAKPIKQAEPTKKGSK
jgi:NTP pyrophosphatase (non-canonical NTP hydrolase)